MPNDEFQKVQNTLLAGVEAMKKNTPKRAHTAPTTPTPPTQEFQSPEINGAGIPEQSEQEKLTAGSSVSVENPKKEIGVLDLVTKFDTSTKIKPQEFIGDIFPRGHISLIGGAPGVGKTWLIIRFVGDLSCGGEIFNGVGYELTPRKCLVFAGELGKDNMIERAQSANIKVNMDNALILDQLEADSENIGIALDTKEGQQNIITLIEHFKPDALFVDSFISFFEGDENKSREIKQAFKFMLTIAKKYNIAVIATHHIRKRLSNEQGKPLVLDDVIGSSVVNRLTSVVVGVEFMKESQNIMVTCLKSWFKHFHRFSYTIKSGFYGQGVIIDIDKDPPEENTSEFSKSEKTSTNSATQDMKTLIKFFLKGRGPSGASIQEIASSLGKTVSDIKMLLSRMRDDGEIIRIKRGIYSIPENETPAKNETIEQIEISEDDI